MRKPQPPSTARHQHLLLWHDGHVDLNQRAEVATSTLGVFEGAVGERIPDRRHSPSRTKPPAFSNVRMPSTE